VKVGAGLGVSVGARLGESDGMRLGRSVEGGKNSSVGIASTGPGRAGWFSWAVQAVRMASARTNDRRREGIS